MLEGENIYLRTVKETDLTLLYFYFDSLRHKGSYLPNELISEHQFRLSFYENGFWSEEKGTILLTKEERLVGLIWYERHALFDCIDLRFYIFEEADRRKGYMQEALSIFSGYLFASRKIERLQIAVPDYSQPALRLVQKCGFTFEGIARAALFQWGRYVDLCLYSLLRLEYKKNLS